MPPPTDSNSDKPSILKSTRVAKGLTLEIVHEATKIPMDALKAIEEGYSVRILSPFYYRGFIKIYAEFLGLDVAEMYKQYGLEEPHKPTTSATVSVKSARGETGPNIFLEQAQEWFAFIFKPKTLKLILKIIGFLLLFFFLFKTAGCIASHMNKKGTPSQKQSTFYSQENKIKVHRDLEEGKTAPVFQEMKHESLKAQSEDDKVEVAVRAIKNTWLRVKTDDKVVFETTLSKGSMETWSADNQIELSGRNIEQLDMEVNGKHIGSLGGGERRIRRVLITREGLTVKK
jgi:cytoskeleton protein RodZ